MYFPNDVYFAFDQARDAFASLEVLKGDFRIIGPPSAASDKLFPGPLVYYLFAPFYGFFNKNPEGVSALIRIINTSGIIIAFTIGSILFHRRTGLIAAVFFAFSYEQTQYALFISHQPLAVIPVLLLYLGLGLVIFKKETRGIILAAFGWGIAIQLHYVYILLAPIVLTIIILFRKQFFRIPLRYVFIASITLIATISTYILAEFLFGFRFTNGIFNSSSTGIHIQPTIHALTRFIHDSFLAIPDLTSYLTFTLMLIFVYFWKHKKEVHNQLIFLALWFIGGLIPYALSGTPSYYYSAAASISLLIFAAYIIQHFFSSISKLFGYSLLIGILINNIYLITAVNKSGLNPEMIIQPSMLLVYEKQALDYIYTRAAKEPFSVNALTIPLNVNTTWSYLFEWYGQQKYGYTPIWGGDAANGYAGNLTVITARSKLPAKRFVIVEPTVGIREHDKNQFFEDESYFTHIIEEKTFGPIIVQLRQPY